MKQIGFYFDQEKCVGCYACVLACKLKNHLEPDVFWRRIVWADTHKSVDDIPSFVSLPCMHCENPLCVKVCPADAITKREEDGIVLVDQDKCLGRDECDKCLKACPYKIPQFGTSNNAKMEKCDFCIDMLNQGKRPDCVIHCSHSAMDAGTMDELRSKYGDLKEAPGFKYSKSARPSFVIKKR